MVKLVKLGLEMGASPILIDAQGCAPVHYAASAGNLEVMQLLIEYGANINCTSSPEHSALSLAIANGNIEVAKLLIAAGARPFEIYSGRPGNPFTGGLCPAIAQRLSLVVQLLKSCPDCDEFTTHYIVSIFLLLFSTPTDTVISYLSYLKKAKMTRYGHRFT